MFASRLQLLLTSALLHLLCACDLSLQPSAERIVTMVVIAQSQASLGTFLL